MIKVAIFLLLLAGVLFFVGEIRKEGGLSAVPWCRRVCWLIAAVVYYEMRRKQQKQAAAARQSAPISSTYTGAVGP